MSPAQQAAFTAASGGQQSSTLLAAIASVLAVFALIWLAWLALRLFDRWSRRGASMGDLLWHLVRATIAISVLGWIAR